LISLDAFLLVSFIPAVGKAGMERLDLVSGVLASVVLGLLIFHAAERRSHLLQTVNLELNKLRRVYHLSKNLSDIDSQRYRGWFTDLHGHLYKYMMGFSERDFSRYEESNNDFRAISYHIYKVPELRSNKEESLYDELLRTIAIVAESRQQIKEAKESGLSAFSWLIVLLLVLSAIVTAWLSMDATDASRVATGAVIAGFFFAVDLLWEVDTLASERKDIARRYVDNISRIELRRRQEE
jgi:ABC-type multidrug transport system fused ATPase/permease subunit